MQPAAKASALAAGPQLPKSFGAPGRQRIENSGILCRYEPWGIVHRHHSPWFDSRFRGYGRNKIMYAAALNSSAFHFVIDPDSFVIHRPHTNSSAQRIFYESQDRRRALR